MANIFFMSDPHFGHRSTYEKFLVNDLPMRPFSSLEEMNETIIARWNERVRPFDKAYLLGDIAMARADIALAGRLNGHKRLVRGNHDNYPMKYYLPYFEEIYGVRALDGMILSHIPLHPESLGGRRLWTVNLHGHTHSNVPALHFGPKYVNVSVEVTNYRPLSLEEVRERIAAQRAYYEASIASPEEDYSDRFVFTNVNGHLGSIAFK